MKQILINSEELQTRVAVVKDGILQDFFMERTDRDSLVGSIYKAKIKNLEPSLQAAFVDIGSGKNAFLHYWDMLPATQEMLEGSHEEAEGESKRPPAAPQSEQRPPKPVEKRPARKKPETTTPTHSATTRETGKTSFLKRVFGKILPLVKPAEEETPAKSEEAGRESNTEAPAQSTESRRPANYRQRKRPPRQPKPTLTVEDIPELFKVDQEVLVQVTKGPIGTKGARVTTNLSIPGRYLVLLPNSTHSGISRRVEEREERDRLRQIIRGLELPPNMGLICRTVGAGTKQEHFQRDLDMLLDSWNKGLEMASKQRAPFCVYQEPDLTERTLRDCLTEDIDEVIADSEEAYKCATSLLMRYNRQSKVKVRLYQNPTPIFVKFGISQQIENISNRKVNLPSGGYICIDETEALIAIDVNTGKNRSGKDHPETILTTNLEAVKEIARQLRLRNIGGLVVLDLIDMRSRKDQQTVFKTFKDLVAEDRARIKLYPISPLGLLEMTRQRENESLESTLYDDCPYCKGRGLVKSTTSMSVEIQRSLNEILARKKNVLRLVVSVHPKVMERLRSDDRKVMDAMAEEFGRQITFRADPTLHIEEFKILDQENNRKL
ncbi:MAG: Rne/Rng family ribonuclease [Lentisphaerae bacterium]|jgi:Rne/Rng family ribonuclease|nr:Rne/Rng family ribonuclease [Lentisphaerota bacterium]